MSIETRRRLKILAFVSLLFWLWFANLPSPIIGDTPIIDPVKIEKTKVVKRKDFKAEKPLVPVPIETKKEPAPARQVDSYSGDIGQWLKALRMCESGGNYKINTGNNYYGAYQFLISTWDRIAQRVRPDLVGVRPDLASPANQDYMIIQNTKLSSGGLVTQNPGCHAKENLSAFPPE